MHSRRTIVVPVGTRTSRGDRFKRDPMKSGFPSSSDPTRLRMEDDLDRYQQQWENEVQKFRQDFFRDTPFADSVFKEKNFRLFPQTYTVTTKTGDHVDTKKIDTSSSFSQEFDLQGFDQDEIIVKIMGKNLTVSATKEDDTGASKITKEFSKSVELPEDVDPDMLTSRLSDDGILTVEVPPPPTYESLPSIEDNINGLH